MNPSPRLPLVHICPFLCPFLCPLSFQTVAQLFGEGHMGNATVPYLATG